MNLFFWQNIISPHQIDFLKALSNHFTITLIVEQVQDNYRINDGWEVPHFDFLNVIIAPKDNILNDFFSNKNDLHVFSGISAYKTVYAGFKMAVANNSKIGLISEPIHMSGFTGFLKLLRGKFQCWKYGDNIDFIATTGDSGIKSYEKFGYSRTKLFQWGYFVDGPCQSFSKKDNNVVFVGNLNDNKQILPLVRLFLDNNYNYNQFQIIGSGDLETEISDLINQNQKIVMHGRLTNLETLNLILKSKLLIIPSLHDGWAVVVNEALMCGTPVIASDSVGASILVENSNRGDVYQTGNLEQLHLLINKWTLEGFDPLNYSEIQDWALKNITPTVAADYFSKIIHFSFHKKTKKPKAPWLQN